MARPATDYPQVEVRSRAEWRAWLAANHDRSRGIWLVTFKRRHPDYLAYDDQVEEALCFGWIDSLTRALDADRSMLLMTPRKPGGGWSAPNKARVARLEAAGLLAPAGRAVIEAARADGAWSKLDAVEALEVPDDLAAALAAAGAREGYEAWPRSVKRGTLEWLLLAKTAPTRRARLDEIAASAARGVRPKPFRR